MRKCLYAQMGFVCFAAVVLLVTIALGQNPAPAPASTAAASSATAVAVAQPAKKVWTNDDLGSLPAVSDPPRTAASTKRPVASPGKASAKAPSAASFQAQIARLQAQLPPIDDQISALQDALAGKPVEEQRKFGWQKPGDWQAQLTALQKKHDDIEVQIQEVEDKARHSGVPTNVVP
jgi:hypothetical protein